MTNQAATGKLMLLEDRRGASPGDGAAPLRRFRLARVRLDPRVEDAGRFEHLKRGHD